MTETSELSVRLDLLGWSISDLVRAYCTQEGIDPTRENIRKYFDTISRAVREPDSIGLGKYKKIIEAAGGKIIYHWTDV